MPGTGLLDKLFSFAAGPLEDWVETWPSWPPAGWDTTPLQGMAGYLSWVGGYLDLTWFAAVLGVIAAFEVVLWGLQFGVYCLRRLHILG